MFQVTIKPYVLMGGQYGSEGKGEVAAQLALTNDFIWSVRTGGPNAGHTVHHDGKVVKMRHIPCAVVNPTVNLALGPGALISLEVLQQEIHDLREAGWWNKGRILYVDRAATMVTKDAVDAEAGMKERIGSTQEGIGASRPAYIHRADGMRAGDAGWREAWEEIKTEIRFIDLTDMWGGMQPQSVETRVLVESTQGFELSLRLSGNYPYVTSTDLTPPQILNDAGILFKTDYEVHIVVRSYPIRVAGNSGPLHDERSWEEMDRDTGGYIDWRSPERTTVTNLPRRIGGWDAQKIKRMVAVLQPNYCTLTFLDYIDPSVFVNLDVGGAADFIDRVRSDISPTELIQVGVGPGVLVAL